MPTFFWSVMGSDGSAGRILACSRRRPEPLILRVRYASRFNQMDRSLSIALPSMPFLAALARFGCPGARIRARCRPSASAFVREGLRLQPGLTGTKYISG
ncbi:hypothetical protein ebA5442 [Aromatoleum aromaticum EbN1]|uniref:Uncharacterized protein n=1 Tax=Aromatoleum aromaticum (strain DSM 19018 / LMG 30748 / EbN1) TaxID=76114 RepID=Q5P0E4_AROAE|nr:hypothetical protein ebA5442 [Aromatoleum aromaticum EbN1]